MRSTLRVVAIAIALSFVRTDVNANPHSYAGYIFVPSAKYNEAVGFSALDILWGLLDGYADIKNRCNKYAGVKVVTDVEIMQAAIFAKNIKTMKTHFEFKTNKIGQGTPFGRNLPLTADPDVAARFLDDVLSHCSGNDMCNYRVAGEAFLVRSADKKSGIYICEFKAREFSYLDRSGFYTTIGIAAAKKAVLDYFRNDH
jgi:hypothetical protein